MKYTVVVFSPEMDEIKNEISTEAVNDFLNDADIIILSHNAISKEEIKCVEQLHRGAAIRYNDGYFDWAYNGSRLGEVGDFENETLKLLLNLNRITNVQ